MFLYSALTLLVRAVGFFKLFSIKVTSDSVEKGSLLLIAQTSTTLAVIF